MAYDRSWLLQAWQTCSFRTDVHLVFVTKYSDASLTGHIGQAILDGLLPPRRPLVSARKVKSPLSRWNKADLHRPTRSTTVTALTVTVSGAETTPNPRHAEISA